MLTYDPTVVPEWRSGSKNVFLQFFGNRCEDNHSIIVITFSCVIASPARLYLALLQILSKSKES